MKKTLFAFSVTVVLSIAVFLAIGLTGCDWFNTTILGKPSQTELAEKEKQRQQELNQLDSIRRAAAQQLAELENKNSQQQTKTGNDDKKPWHVIVSCYEEKVNVDNMMAQLKSIGYEPYTLPMGNLTAVSAAGFDTEQEAWGLKNKLEDSDYEFVGEIEDEIWVYKKP
jgi:cell division septation protein DedD